MNDFTASTAPAGDIDAQIAELTLAEPPTPQAARARNEKLEALHMAKAAAGEAAAASRSSDAAAEGFEPPSSPLAYNLEQNVPPGLTIENEHALGALKSGLHSIGVPAEIASGGFAEIAHLHAAGAFASDAAYDQQLGMCRAAMHKVHGEAAPAMIRDGLAVVDQAVKAGKITEDVAEAIIASPMALSHAANMKRLGGRR